MTSNIQQSHTFKSVRTYSADRRKMTQKKHELELSEDGYFPPEKHCVVPVHKRDVDGGTYIRM